MLDALSLVRALSENMCKGCAAAAKAPDAMSNVEGIEKELRELCKLQGHFDLTQEVSSGNVKQEVQFFFY